MSGFYWLLGFILLLFCFNRLIDRLLGWYDRFVISFSLSLSLSFYYIPLFFCVRRGQDQWPCTSFAHQRTQSKWEWPNHCCNQIQSAIVWFVRRSISWWDLPTRPSTAQHWPLPNCLPVLFSMPILTAETKKPRNQEVDRGTNHQNSILLNLFIHFNQFLTLLTWSITVQL